MWAAERSRGSTVCSDESLKVSRGSAREHSKTKCSSSHSRSGDTCPSPPIQSKRMAESRERTFIAIKPDAVQRGIVGKVIERFEQRGYKLVAMKMVRPSRAHLEEHYVELKDKPFFPTLIEYMSSGPVVAMVWEGLDVVKQGRAMLGATNPLNSAPGTIRGDFSIMTGRNIVHGSDSLQSAKREIAHWFKPEEIMEWSCANDKWIYE
ncbi:hypothetical protein AB6A40_003485 [Gnathostoma spinigerum]|uniref:Nucleoside diphosphate kinase n=1 Tax=Gnathostoma spinigerum TaxID=75299 RepID=A0ABD6EAW2_9BILA